MLHNQSHFQTIDAIADADLRRYLYRLIDDINRIIAELEPYPQDPYIVTNVNRFFRYLTESCKSRGTIVRRATWICTYGSITLNGLREYHGRLIRTSDNYYQVRHADMVEKIVTVSTLLKEYEKRLGAEDRYALDTLHDAIVEQLPKIKVTQSDAYYTTIERYSDKIINMLKSVCGDDASSKVIVNQFNLLNNLHWLLYRLQNYRKRVG